MRILVDAPSNIAFIKYMGKSSSSVNLPTNASFSLTLPHLKTFLEITENAGTDTWELLPGYEHMELSPTGLAKFLKHFVFLKETFSLGGNYKIRSANNFPSDAGIASSASAFAALTKGAWELALVRIGQEKAFAALGVSSEEEIPYKLAALSRKGSGSSCRSFFGPWCYWKGSEVKPLDLPALGLKHYVILCETEKKQVSSSEAHERVTTSYLFEGRVERAEKRLVELESTLRNNTWIMSFQILWEEFWDMHALFHTSRPAFSYMNADTIKVLDSVRQYWSENGDGPLVTMDAGANVHVFFRKDAKPAELLKIWSRDYSILGI